MITLTQHLSTHLRRVSTPRGERIPAQLRAEIAADRTWSGDHWERLDRFLVFGSEGGTYYIGERELTIDNARAVIECLAEDGSRVVQRVLDIDSTRRAVSNDPSLFVLAIAASLGDDATWAAALAALPRIATTGTHLAHWLRYVNDRSTAHLARLARRAD